MVWLFIRTAVRPVGSEGIANDFGGTALSPNIFRNDLTIAFHGYATACKEALMIPLS